MTGPSKEELTLALEAIHQQLCIAEKLNTFSVPLARHIIRAIEYCKYLKQPEWSEAISRYRLTSLPSAGPLEPDQGPETE